MIPWVGSVPRQHSAVALEQPLHARGLAVPGGGEGPVPLAWVGRGVLAVCPGVDRVAVERVVPPREGGAAHVARARITALQTGWDAVLGGSRAACSLAAKGRVAADRFLLDGEVRNGTRMARSWLAVGGVPEMGSGPFADHRKGSSHMQDGIQRQQILGPHQPAAPSMPPR